MKLEVLKPHAHKFDLDHEADYARPGNSPPERAFQLLSCGFDLFLVIADSALPTLDRGARRSGRRWIRENLIHKGAYAAGFMARSASTLLALTRGRLSDDGDDASEAIVDPEYHRMLTRSIEDFYPKLKKGPRQQADPLENCVVEFEVMEKHEPREKVASGDEPATQYSMALLRGEVPHEDPELVEMQRRYARDFFIHRASLSAMRISLEVGDVRRLVPKMIPHLDPDDARQSDYRAHALAAWIEGSRPYREYALLEFQNAPAAAAPVGQPR